MKSPFYACIILGCLLVYSSRILCQEAISATDKVLQFPDKLIGKLSNKATDINKCRIEDAGGKSPKQRDLCRIV